MSARDDLVAAMEAETDAACAWASDDHNAPKLQGEASALAWIAIKRHGKHLLALLTEPTLEEVLAELAEHTSGGPHLSYEPWSNPESSWFCEAMARTGIAGITRGNGAAPLQAARECLRRVKEVGSE